MNYVSVNVRQTAFQSVVVERETFVVQAYEVKQCCVEIVDRHFVDDGLETEFITFTIAEGPFHTGACQETGECAGIMITASPVRLQERHATEFRGPNDQGVLEKASLLHVGE